MSFLVRVSSVMLTVKVKIVIILLGYRAMFNLYDIQPI